jgi:hypothetical protein
MQRLKALWCKVRGYHRSYHVLPPAGCVPMGAYTFTAADPVSPTTLFTGQPCMDCGKEQPAVKVTTINSGPYKWEG